jgi:hypothetical protein
MFQADLPHPAARLLRKQKQRKVCLAGISDVYLHCLPEAGPGVHLKRSLVLSGPRFIVIAYISPAFAAFAAFRTVRLETTATSLLHVSSVASTS